MGTKQNANYSIIGLKNHKNSFSKLEKNLKSITGILVDFDDTVAIIKNNEK